MTDTSRAWLAGLLEGEGTFIPGPPSCPNQPIVQVAMTDADVIERAARLMGVTPSFHKRDKRNANWKDYYVARVKGRPAMMLMEELRPLMGQRRVIQITKAMLSYKNMKSRKLSDAAVKQIRREAARAGANISRIAKKFKVSRYTIRQVRDRKLHAGV